MKTAIYAQTSKTVKKFLLCLAYGISQLAALSSRTDGEKALDNFLPAIKEDKHLAAANEYDTPSLGSRRLKVITAGPVNTAVITGSSATLYCASDSSDRLNWAKDGIDLPIVMGCTVHPAYANIYAVDDRGSGHCNLVILNATAAMAGKYQCQESTDFDRLTAQLVVLDSEPICKSEFPPEPMEGDNVTISCEVNYTTNFSPMSMTWTNSAGNAVRADYELASPGQLKSVLVISATIPIVPSFTCKTEFRDLGTSADITEAANTPDYVHNYSSDVIYIHVCPTSVKITPTESMMAVGDILTCSADGYPPPAIDWQNLDTDDITSGSTLEITQEGPLKFRCIATSSIHQIPCRKFSTIFFSAIDMKAPVNTAKLDGSLVTLQCRRQSQKMVWNFLAVNQKMVVSIVVNCVPVAGYGDVYQVDMSDNSCHLIINGLTAEEAGTYTCQDVTMPELPLSAQVIYIFSEPDCRETVINPPPLEVSDSPILLQCKIEYFGNIPAAMKWLDAEGNIVSGANITFTNNSSLSTFHPIVRAGPNFGPYRCLIYFNSPVFDPPQLNQKPDLTPPEYKSEFQSEVYHVAELTTTMSIASSESNFTIFDISATSWTSNFTSSGQHFFSPKVRPYMVAMIIIVFTRQF